MYKWIADESELLELFWAISLPIFGQTSPNFILQLTFTLN